MKISALRERFRSRLHTYLQACVLVASRRDIHGGQKRQQCYLDAAYGALRHYSEEITNNMKKSRKFLSLDDPELFNTVLLGFVHGANEGWHVDVRDRCLNLRSVMRKHNVKPNEGTLAAFYLLSHLPSEIRNRVNKKTDEYYHNGITKAVNEMKKILTPNSKKFLYDPRLNENNREILYSLFASLPIDGNNGQEITEISSNTTRYKRTLLKSLNEPYFGLQLESNHDEFESRSIFQSKNELMEDFAIQLEREKQGVVAIPSAYRTEYTEKNIYELIIDEIRNQWKRQLVRKFQEQKERETRKSENRMTYGGVDSYKINIAPFLNLMDTRNYVDVMFNEAIRLSTLSDTHGIPLKILCGDLGKRLMAKVKLELAENYGLVDKIKNCYEYYTEYFMNWNRLKHLNYREYWIQIANELNPLNPGFHVDTISCENDWLQYELGEFLYDIIIDSLKVPASLTDAVRGLRSKKINTIKELKLVDAFFKAMSTYGVRCYEEIRCHPTLSNLHKKTIAREIQFDATEVPLICPPIPWHRHDKGQLLISPIDLIRLESNGARSLQHTNRILAQDDDMFPVLDSLNVLGSTPWMINRPVLDVMLKIFRGDGNMKLDIPPAQSRLEKLPDMNPKKGTIFSQEEKAALMKRRIEMKKAHAENYSLWCTAHYRFSLAEYLKDKIIWFPHNVDFRGRAYPVPPILNHMGDDVCRGMIQFAQGRPLGKDGLRWLKMHLINLTGLKKRASLEERLEYANEIMGDALDSASNPLDGKKWWMKSEEPWQTLAVCMEIEKALNSENVEEYICCLPVHQDGSCNGLQHYAALGRDQQGAEQVNLHPADIPQDVYSAVAAKIEEKRANDAAAGLQIAQVLDGYVRRKVIKQTVMTIVYGVTRYGGRAQIGRQLKDIEDFPQEHVFQASAYLVQRLFESIGEIFQTARQIQDWFVKSSLMISGRLHKTVEWITPMGFPVAQPYFKPVNSCKSFAHEDKLSEASTRPFPIDFIEQPYVLKQKNGFPPNYIHSLDGTHMMLTSLHCQRQGIMYAAVHDSFWTHASTVSQLNRICRKQFVALHSQPLLEELSQFFIWRYVDSELAKFSNMKRTGDMEKQLEELEQIRKHFLSLPKLGDFDLESVQKSPYFFC